MIFEHDETANPKQLLECKNVILQNGLIRESKQRVLVTPKQNIWKVG